LPGRNHAVQHRRDHIPDLRPDLLARPAERPRMLPAEDLGVGIVVKHDALGAPIEDDGETRADADAQRAAQALRPGLDRPERALRPVERADALAHFAAAGEPSRRGAVLGFGMVHFLGRPVCRRTPYGYVAGAVSLLSRIVDRPLESLP